MYVHGRGRQNNDLVKLVNIWKTKMSVMIHSKCRDW